MLRLNKKVERLHLLGERLTDGPLLWSPLEPTKQNRHVERLLASVPVSVRPLITPDWRVANDIAIDLGGYRGSDRERLGCP